MNDKVNKENIIQARLPSKDLQILKIFWLKIYL